MSAQSADILIRPGQEGDRAGIAQAVAEAFYEYFRAIGKSRQEIAGLLAHLVQPERVTVAIGPDGQVLGAVGCGDERGYSVEPLKEPVMRSLGPVRGFFALQVMRDEFRRPRTFEPGEGHVDWVAVREKARGQRLASRMLAHLLSRRQYPLYTLDVVAGNEHVMPIYESVGFREVRREKEKGGWYKGFRFRHIMACRPSEDTAHG